MKVSSDGALLIEAWDTIDHPLLVKAFRVEDDLTKILLLTFEIEAQLGNMIEKVLKEDVSRMKFYEKCIVLKSMRFENDIFHVVDNFRKLRNRFAHEKNASFEKEHRLVEAILRAKPPILDDIKRFRISIGKAGERAEGILFSELPRDKQLVVFGIIAAQFLSAAPELYEFRPPLPRVKVAGAIL